MGGNIEMPDPLSMIAPEPREDVDGKYMSPFTSDDVIAPWVEKGMNAKMGAVVGSYGAQKALSSVPFSSFFAHDVGSEIGRKAALEMVGGEEYMKSTTDLSFDAVEDLIVYTYIHHSTHPDYEKVKKLVTNIYPEFGQEYATALWGAVSHDKVAD